MIDLTFDIIDKTIANIHHQQFGRSQIFAVEKVASSIPG